MKRYVSLATAILVGTVLAKKEKTYGGNEVAKAASSATAEIKAVQGVILESKNPNHARESSKVTSQTSAEEVDLTSNGTSLASSKKVRAASPTSEGTSVTSKVQATSVSSATTAKHVRAETSVTSITTRVRATSVSSKTT